MAEIDIEKQPRRGWSVALAVLVLLLVVGVAWYLAGAPGTETIQWGSWGSDSDTLGVSP